MPSGPEGDQEISEHTLMHPKYKTTGFHFSLVSLSFLSFPHIFFVCDSFLRLWVVLFSLFFFLIFRLSRALIRVSIFLPPFVLLLFIAHVMNWFPLPHLIQGVLGLEWGWNFLRTKLQKLLSKPKCVFHQ